MASQTLKTEQKIKICKNYLEKKKKKKEYLFNKESKQIELTQV